MGADGYLDLHRVEPDSEYAEPAAVIDARDGTVLVALIHITDFFGLRLYEGNGFTDTLLAIPEYHRGQVETPRGLAVFFSRLLLDETERRRNLPWGGVGSLLDRVGRLKWGNITGSINEVQSLPHGIYAPDLYWETDTHDELNQRYPLPIGYRRTGGHCVHLWT